VRRLLALVTITLVLSGCASAERPEGIVERWLTSLNQGAAGQPERYAPDAVSEQVLPGWQDLDPGEIDVIVVVPGQPGEGGIDQVPFRIETIDGDELRALANVDAGRVTGIVTSEQTPLPPSLFEDRRPIDAAPSTAWLAAIGLALLFILLAAALMTVVRRRVAATST
jgi:hypothetical protein